jgi:serine/threonine-protein kinase
LGPEIARGGMGAVLKGRDPELNREVAVKVLLEAHRDRPECARRFLEEAQIGGQLQHPGTVPVYELGRFPDGRPFFTMKLVKGHTLARLLAQRAAPPGDLSRWLSIFEQICQAVAYAHARGVIHRDLKPANVMVGAFGEVQLMDWGMAKVLGRPEPPDAGPAPPAAGSGDSTVIQTLRSESNTEVSRAGTLMGTPAYIPPEQAKGEVGAMDERSDVFGLGAILCTILTGQPPYSGGGFLELMEKAVQGDVAEAFARLDGSGADEELIRLGRECLAPAKEARPRDAGAVAARVAAYRAGVQERLRKAELESAAAHARAAEERKRHRLTAALALAVLGILLVVAGSGIWLERQDAALKRQAAERRAEEVKRLDEVESALVKADGLQKGALWGEARAVLDQAQARLGETGPDDLRRRLAEALAGLNLVRRLDAIRLERAAFNDVENRFDGRKAARDYAAAFGEAGFGKVGEEEEAVAGRIRDSAIQAQLIAALDDWANVAETEAQREWVLGVARLADPDDLRNRFRDPAAWKEPAALERLAEEASADGDKAAALTPQLLNAVAGKLPRSKAIPLLKAGQQRNPNDFWLNLLLGKAVLEAGRAAEAVGYYRAALAARPKTAVVYLNLGKALGNSRQREDAVVQYQEALNLDPRFARAHYNLGTVLHDLIRLDEAMREYRTALDLNPRILGAYTNLGNALRDTGRPAEAVDAYRQALDLVTPKREKLVLTYNGLGLALCDLDRRDEAIQAFCTAIRLNDDAQFVWPDTNLGSTLFETGRLEESVSAFKRAIARNGRHAPSNAYLGRSLLALERFDQAAAATRRALQNLPADAPQRSEITQQLERCTRLLAIKDRVPALLRREVEPKDNAERLLLAEFCQEDKRLFAAAAHFYDDAFAADPKLTDDLMKSRRYNAACVAAKAGCGKGADAAMLDAGQRACLRRRALDWLRAELLLWEKEAARADPEARDRARKMVGHWEKDRDLAGLRERGALRQLPEDERNECYQLWADVAALLAKLKDKGAG